MATAPIEDKSMRRDVDPRLADNNSSSSELAPRHCSWHSRLERSPETETAPSSHRPPRCLLAPNLPRPRRHRQDLAWPRQAARAVLALPGLTTPSSRPSMTTPPSSPALESVPGELSLDAPIEMRAVPSPARPNTTIAPGRSPDRSSWNPHPATNLCRSTARPTGRIPLSSGRQHLGSIPSRCPAPPSVPDSSASGCPCPVSRTEFVGNANSVARSVLGRGHWRRFRSGIGPQAADRAAGPRGCGGASQIDRGPTRRQERNGPGPWGQVLPEAGRP